MWLSLRPPAVHLEEGGGEASRPPTDNPNELLRSPAELISDQTQRKKAEKEGKEVKVQDKGPQKPLMLCACEEGFQTPG